MKFNQKEIVDNAIEQAKVLCQCYFEKILFVHNNDLSTLLLLHNAFNKLLSNNIGLGKLLLIKDPTLHDYSKVKMSSVYCQNNNLVIWFPVFRESLSQSLFHKTMVIQKYYPEYVFSLNYTCKYICDNREIFVSEIISKLINFYIHAMNNPFKDAADISVAATYGTAQEIDLEINDFIKKLDLYRIILIYKRLKSNTENLEAFIDELTIAYLALQNNKNWIQLDQIIVNLKRNSRFVKPKQKKSNYSKKFDNKKKLLKKYNKLEHRCQNSVNDKMKLTSW